MVDSEPLHFEAERIALAGRNVSYERADKAEFVGVPVVEVMQELARRHAIDDVGSLLEDRDAAFRRLVSTSLEMNPGVLDLIHRLHERGIPCAVVSSGVRSYVETVLDRFDLRRFFAATVTLDDVRAHKPAPEPYLTAARKLGIAPERCVGFEDSPAGVASVKAAGMYCVAVPSDLTRAVDLTAADKRVESMTLVDDTMLDRLFA